MASASTSTPHRQHRSASRARSSSSTSSGSGSSDGGHAAGGEPPRKKRCTSPSAKSAAARSPRVTTTAAVIELSDDDDEDGEEASAGKKEGGESEIKLAFKGERTRAAKSTSAQSASTSTSKHNVVVIDVDDDDDDEVALISPSKSAAVNGVRSKDPSVSKQKPPQMHGARQVSKGGSASSSKPPLASIFQPRDSSSKLNAPSKDKEEKKRDPLSSSSGSSTSPPPPPPVAGTSKSGAEGSADTKPRLGFGPSGFGASSSSSNNKGGGDIVPAQLDVDILAFQPSRDVSTAQWPGGRMPYAFLVHSAFVPISATRSRLAIVRILTNLLRAIIELDPASLLPTIYLTINRLAPPHEPDSEMGIGSQVLTKAIQDSSGLSRAALKTLYNKHGDAGDVAAAASQNVRVLVRPPQLLCHSVYATLVGLTKLKGQGSQGIKTDKVKGLLVAARGPEEVRFLVRTLVQHLRIGAVRLTLTHALARAFCLSAPPPPPPSNTETSAVDVDVHRQSSLFISRDECEALVDSSAAFDAAAAAAANSASSLSKGKGKGNGKTAASGKGKGNGKTAASGKGKQANGESDLLRTDVTSRLERAEKLVRGVWARHPDYAHIVDGLLSGGLDGLEERVPLALGTPVQHMLGSITRSLADVYARLGDRPFVSEAKLDGQRAQIHVALQEPAWQNGKGRWYSPPPGVDGVKIWVRVFSRHLEDMTDKYPDLLSTLSLLVARHANTDGPNLESFMLDSEIVAIDPVTGDFRTFQELSYRSRKDVELGQIKVRVGVYAFDLMFLNGEPLLQEPFRRRRELLHQFFAPLRPEDPRLAKWEVMPSTTDCSPEAVKAFFEEALKMKAEGIMVKLLDEVELDADGLPVELDQGQRAVSESPTKAKRGNRKTLPASYEPDKRADSWLKVKKDYLDDLGDSLDLVPIGAWHGQGRKASWWSPFLLAVYDEEAGGFTGVCKIISGFTDAFYKENRAKYAPGEPTTSSKPFPSIVAGGLRPDIWFNPQEVWEIRGADFTLSPVYPAAAGLVSDRGISVRFPRMIKRRDDKSVEQATTAEQLAELYRKQGTSVKDEGDEE